MRDSATNRLLEAAPFSTLPLTCFSSQLSADDAKITSELEQTKLGDCIEFGPTRFCSIRRSIEQLRFWLTQARQTTTMMQLPTLSLPLPSPLLLLPRLRQPPPLLPALVRRARHLSPSDSERLLHIMPAGPPTSMDPRRWRRM